MLLATTNQRNEATGGRLLSLCTVEAALFGGRRVERVNGRACRRSVLNPVARRAGGRDADELLLLLLHFRNRVASQRLEQTGGCLSGSCLRRHRIRLISWLPGRACAPAKRKRLVVVQLFQSGAQLLLRLQTSAEQAVLVRLATCSRIRRCLLAARPLLPLTCTRDSRRRASGSLRPLIVVVLLYRIHLIGGRASGFLAAVNKTVSVRQPVVVFVLSPPSSRLLRPATRLAIAPAGPARRSVQFLLRELARRVKVECLPD